MHSCNLRINFDKFLRESPRACQVVYRRDPYKYNNHTLFYVCMKKVYQELGSKVLGAGDSLGYSTNRPADKIVR